MVYFYHKLKIKYSELYIDLEYLLKSISLIIIQFLLIIIILLILVYFIKDVGLLLIRGRVIVNITHLLVVERFYS